MIHVDDKITAIGAWIVYEPRDTVMVGRRVFGPLAGYVVSFNEWSMTATFLSPEGAKTFGYRLCNEGVWWIQGHHDPGSPEVVAMLAAHALIQDGSVLAL